MTEINLSQEEYRHLLDLVAITDWVMHAFDTEENKETAPYRNLIQKILSRAEDAGLTDLVEYSEESKKYFPTAKFDESSRFYDILDSFIDDMFWDELSERFVQRDLIKILGRAKYHALSIRDRFEKEAPIRNRYEIEFSNHGIMNMKIISEDD